MDENLWDGVQAVLAANRVERCTGSRALTPSLLAGLLYDETGQRMTPTHANKKGRRYRYYVSQTLITRARNNGAEQGWRVPASDIEGLVEDRILSFLRDEVANFNVLQHEDVNARTGIVRRIAHLAGRRSALDAPEKRNIFRHLIPRIVLQHKDIKIHVRVLALPVITDPDKRHDAHSPEAGHPY